MYFGLTMNYWVYTDIHSYINVRAYCTYAVIQMLELESLIEALAWPLPWPSLHSLHTAHNI